MTHDDVPAYGLWSLVIINSAVFIFFAFSFFKPQTKRDWRSFSAFSAFLVALFTEMYGFPLTIYLLSGWLQSRYPNVNWFSHDAGHLLEMMFGWKSNPHFGPFHLLSFAFIGGGFHRHLGRVESALRGAAQTCARDHGHLFLRPAPAICRLHPDNVRIPLAMADIADPGDVPGTGVHVCAAGADRGARILAGVRRRIPRLYASACPDLSRVSDRAAARRRPRSRPSLQGRAGSGIPADDRHRTRSPGPGRYHA